MKVLGFIKEKYPIISKEYRKGVKGKIKPINRLFLNFIDDPTNNFPTLGNWVHISREIVEGLDPKNPVMQDMYDFIEKIVAINKEMLKQIIEVKDIFLDERNFGTHRRLYSKEEVEIILRTITPIVNDLIEYLLSLVQA